MVDISALIANAQTTGQVLVGSARAELSGSASALASLVNGSGLAGIEAVAPPLPEIAAFVPALAPTLTQPVVDTSGAPTGQIFTAPTFGPLTINTTSGRPTDKPTLPTEPEKITIDTSGAPTIVPALDSVPTMDVGYAPHFSASPPTFNMPTSPGGTPAFTGAEPSINTNFTFPDAPAALNEVITAPLIADRLIPTAPEVQIPVFDIGAMPAAPDAPGDFTASVRATYSELGASATSALEGQLDAMLHKINPRFSEQLAAIEDQIARYMQGGSGLKPKVEDAIYERAKGKTDAEYRRVRDTVYTEAARRGFTVPTGATFSALQQAKQAGADNNARAAIEIAIKMAEMEQQNLQFAVTTSAQLRQAAVGAAISYHQSLVSLNGQIVNMAQTVLSAQVQTYEAVVRAFSAKLEAYKANVTVFEARIRAALSIAELYKAQIQGLEAATQVDIAKISAYRTRVETLTSYANVYRAQIDAVVSKASLEKLKIDSYATRVAAYSSLVQAKTAEWQGYSAAIRGEEAKAGIYTAQIGGYAAEVNAYRAKIEAESAKVQASATKNRGAVENFVALNQAYSAKVSAQATRAGAEGESQKIKLQAHAAMNDAIRAEYTAYETIIRAEGARVQAEGDTQKIALEVYRAANQAYATQWQAYSAKMSAEGMKVSAAGEFNRDLLMNYTQANAAAVATANASAERYRAVAQVQIEQGRLLATQVQEAARIRLSAASGLAQTAVSAGGVYSSLAASALNGVNTLVSLSGSA